MAVVGVARLTVGENRGETHAGGIDFGRFDREANVAVGEVHALAFVDVLHDLVGVHGFEGEHRGHVLHGEIGFEVGGLVGDDGVAGGVAFVETVAGEFQDEVEDAFGVPFGNTLFVGAFDEVLALGIDGVFLLFADRFDERVGGAQGHTTELVHDLHDLLLVDHDAVRLAGVFFDDRVHLRDGLATVFARVVVVDQLHRAGPVEGVGGDQVFEAVRAHGAQEAAHAVGFELEDGDGFAAAEEVEHTLVFEVQAVEVEGIEARTFAAVGVDGLADGVGVQGGEHQLASLFDDRQGAQAEEVHLEQADLFAGRAVPLGDEHVFVAALFVDGERQDFGERDIRDHHTRGVDAGVAGEAFELAGGVDPAADVGVAVVQLAQLGRLFEGVVEGDVELVADQAADFVDFGEGAVHHPADVADDGFGLEHVEGDDLGDLAHARGVVVFLPDVVDDFTATVLADVDIDIGIFRAVGVGEPFEEQAVMHGAGVGEAEAITRHGADAGATGVGGDAAAAGFVDEVPDDEEVGGDVFVGEDAQLAVEAGAVVAGDVVAITPDGTGVGQLAEDAVAVFFELFGGFVVVAGVEGEQLVLGAEGFEPAGGARRVVDTFEGGRAPDDFDDGGVTLRKVEIDLAAGGDFGGIFEGFEASAAFVGLEELVHLLRRFDEELFGVFEAVFVFLDFADGDTNQGVVAVPVFGAQEVGVVVADQGQRKLAGEAHEVGVDGLLLGDVALEFDIKTRLTLRVRAKGAGMPKRFVDGGLPVAFVARFDVVLQVMGQGGTEVAIDGDEPLAPTFEGRFVHPRLVVEAMDEGVGAELQKVLPARIVFGQQNQVEAAVGNPGIGLVRAVRAPAVGIGRDISLDAEDRFDAGLFGLGIEVDRAIEIAMIGHGNGIHAKVLDPGNQPIDPVGTVEQAVLSVQMKVNEGAAHDAIITRHRFLRFLVFQTGDPCGGSRCDRVGAC